MRRLLLLMIPLALVLAACGEKSEPKAGGGELQPFRLILDYTPNADHAAIYTAEASGEFARAGLDVEIVTPSDPAAPLRLLAAGQADLAISYEPELLLARDQGTNLVSVGALVQKPLTTLMAIEGSGVKTVADLKGKTIGTAGIPYQDAYLKTILADAGVPESDVRKIGVGFNLVPAMLAKRVDATLGAFWNVEGVDLALKNKNPTILRMENLGVPNYNELILVAERTSLTTEQASRLRRFLGALARGAATARDTPATAVAALQKADRGADAKLLEESVKATTGVFFPTQANRPWGFQDIAEWEDYGKWMSANKLVDKDPKAENALTNEFLPGQGLAANTAEP
jgi:putative hydroxymethylpyrimidine transport system substrate-binding protein